MGCTCATKSAVVAPQRKINYESSTKNVNRSENPEESSEIIPIDPQPDYTYYVYELIYQIPNVFVYQISNNGNQQLTAYGNLDIMQYKNQQDESQQLLLQVNTNFFYFLNKNIGILESPDHGDMFSQRRHFIFPGIECNYDICIMNIQSILMIQYLEAILAENSNLFIPEVQIQQIQPQANQIAQQEQPQEKEQEETKQQQQQQQPQKKKSMISGMLNKGSELLKQGGELIRQGIKFTSKFICYSLQKTGDFLKKKLPKTQIELQIDPTIMSLIHDAHQKKKEKFQLTASLIAQVSKDAIEIGIFFGKKLGIQKDNTAVVMTEEVVDVYDGMLNAINCVEQNMIQNAVELVEEQFGHDAAVAAREGLEMGVIQTDTKQILKEEVAKAVKQEKQ